MFDKFVEEKYPKLKGKYLLEKEKRTRHGRIDIFAIEEKKAIIIENKIKSGLNGIDKQEEKTQLQVYVKAMKEEFNIDKENIFGLVFVPDYNKSIIEKEIRELEKVEIINYYNIISYSELLYFFEKYKNIVKEDLYYDYYEDFLKALKNHTYKDIDEKNRTETEKKFIYAINKAKNSSK